MADLSELTDTELYLHFDWLIEVIDSLNLTGQDPVGTDVWEWYEEALDESDRRETIQDAWRQR